jgi:hypothetical protein
VSNRFTSHPDEIGESYGEHLARASWSGVKLIGSGIACMVHAIFPFLFEHVASDTIKDLHRGMIKKVDAPNWERHPII